MMYGMMYARNKRTGEHIKADKHTVLPWREWEFVQADADGWIEWEGEECPLPEGVLCEVKGVSVYRDRAEEFDWQYFSRYRPILDAKPSEPEAPEWDGEVAIEYRDGRIVGVTIPKGSRNGRIRISSTKVEIQRE